MKKIENAIKISLSVKDIPENLRATSERIVITGSDKITTRLDVKNQYSIKDSKIKEPTVKSVLFADDCAQLKEEPQIIAAGINTGTSKIKFNLNPRFGSKSKPFIIATPENNKDIKRMPRNSIVLNLNFPS